MNMMMIKGILMGAGHGIKQNIEHKTPWALVDPTLATAMSIKHDIKDFSGKYGKEHQRGAFYEGAAGLGAVFGNDIVDFNKVKNMFVKKPDQPVDPYASNTDPYVEPVQPSVQQPNLTDYSPDPRRREEDFMKTSGRSLYDTYWGSPYYSSYDRNLGGY